MKETSAGEKPNSVVDYDDETIKGMSIKNNNNKEVIKIKYCNISSPIVIAMKNVTHLNN